MLLWLRMLRVCLELCESFGELAVPIPFANKFDCVWATCVGRAWKQCLWDHGFTWWFTVVFITKKHWGNHSTLQFSHKYCCKYSTRSHSRWCFQIFFIFIPTWGDDPLWLIFFRWVETTNQHLICLWKKLEIQIWSDLSVWTPSCSFQLSVRERDDGRKKRRGPVWDPGLIWIHPSKGAIWTLRDGVQGPLIHSAHLGRSRYMNYLYIYSVEWLPTLIRAVTHWELCISQFLVEDSHFASPGRTESKIESQSSGGTVAGPVLPTKSAKVSGRLYSARVFPYISLTA